MRPEVDAMCDGAARNRRPVAMTEPVAIAAATAAMYVQLDENELSHIDRLSAAIAKR